MVKFGEAPKQSNIIKKMTLVDDEIKFVNILSVDEDFFLNPKTHFVKGVGSIHCTSSTDDDGIRIKGDCCKVLEDLISQEVLSEETTKSYPSSKYVLPAMVFTTVDKNNFQLPVSFVRLELTEKDYKALLDEFEDSEVDPITIPSKILRIKGTSEGEGRFKRVSPKIKVKGGFDITKNPQLVEQAKNFLISYRELIRPSLGKDLNGDKLKNAILQNVSKSQETLASPQLEALPQPVAQPQVQQQQTVAGVVGLSLPPQQVVVPPVSLAPLPQPAPVVTPVQAPVQTIQLPSSTELEGLDLSEIIQDVDDFYTE